MVYRRCQQMRGETMTPDYAASRAFLRQPGALSVADIQHHAAILAHSPDPTDRLIGRTLDHPSPAAQALTAAARRRANPQATE